MPHIPPPAVAAGAALAQWAISRRHTSTRASRVGAAVVLAASAGLAGRSVGEFVRLHTTVSPLEPERASTVVDTGPFRLTRNPMYVGLAGVLASQAIRRRSPAATLPVAVFVAVMDRTQVAAEERALTAKFGQAYEEYARRVPRWLDVRSVRRLVSGYPAPAQTDTT